MHKGPLMIKVKTKTEAERFLRQCVIQIGEGFHPDTNGEDYENWKKKKTFTKEQAKKYDYNIRKVFELLTDPYDMALNMYNAQYGRKD